MIVQFWIAFTGLIAILLLQFGGERSRKVAPFIGLASQPAWLAHAIDSHAGGVLVISLAYTAVWAAGCVKALRPTGHERCPHCGSEHQFRGHCSYCGHRYIRRRPLVRFGGFWRRVWTR